MIVEHCFQITAVRVVEQFGAIREKNQSRRMHSDLGRVIQLRSAILSERRRLLLQRPPDHAIQLAGTHAGAGLLVQILSQV